MGLFFLVCFEREWEREREIYLRLSFGELWYGTEYWEALKGGGEAERGSEQAD